MAVEKIKILIVSDCKIGGAHVDKGTLIDIDPNVAADKNNYALLVHAGRVAEASEENIAKCKAEMDAEAKIKSANDKASKSASVGTDINAIVAAVLAGLKAQKA